MALLTRETSTTRATVTEGRTVDSDLTRDGIGCNARIARTRIDGNAAVTSLEQRIALARVTVGCIDTLAAILARREHRRARVRALRTRWTC